MTFGPSNCWNLAFFNSKWKGLDKLDLVLRLYICHGNEFWLKIPHKFPTALSGFILHTMSNRKVRYQLERFPELYHPVMICWIQVRFLDCNFKKTLNTEKPFKKLIIAYRQWKVWVQKAAGSNIDAIRLARLERNRSKFDNNRQRSRSLSNSSWEIPCIKFCQGNYTRMRWKLL